MEEYGNARVVSTSQRLQQTRTLLLVSEARRRMTPANLRRALVVDDDPEIRRSLERWLRPEIELYMAASVAQAKALLAGLDRLELALVDLELPDGSGEEVLEQVARFPDVISVLMSGAFKAEPAAPSPAPVDRAASVHERGKPGRRKPAASAHGAAEPSRGEPSWNDSSLAKPAADPGIVGCTIAGSSILGNSVVGTRIGNRALVNLVLAKPIAPSVIIALKKAALELALY